MLVIYLFYLLFFRKVKLYLIVGTYKILIYYEYEGKYKKVVGRERMHILNKIFCIQLHTPLQISPHTQFTVLSYKKRSYFDNSTFNKEVHWNRFLISVLKK